MSAIRLSFRDAQAAQPTALARIATIVAAQLERPEVLRLRQARDLVFAGIGASHAAAALPEYLLQMGGRRAHRIVSSDAIDNARVRQADAFIAISQGGMSTETLEALDGVPFEHRFAVVNVTPSPVSERSAQTISLGNQPDSWASTVGMTGTLVALSMLSRTVLGEDATTEWLDIESLARDIHDAAQEFAAELVGPLGAVKSVDVVARQSGACSAESAALMLREVVRLPASAYGTRTYLHGAMESAGESLHLVFGANRELSLAASLAAAGHPTVLVTEAETTPQPNLHVLRVPNTTDSVRAVLETIAVQVLSTAAADARGIDIEDFVFQNDDIKLGGIEQARTLTGPA